MRLKNPYKPLPIIASLTKERMLLLDTLWFLHFQTFLSQCLDLPKKVPVSVNHNHKLISIHKTNTMPWNNYALHKPDKLTTWKITYLESSSFLIKYMSLWATPSTTKMKHESKSHENTKVYIIDTYSPTMHNTNLSIYNIYIHACLWKLNQGI